MAKQNKINRPPLSRLNILDFSTLLPGPYATLMLADLGANVLRVESPTRRDLVQDLPPIIDGLSAAHHYLNRNKRSIALDLTRHEGVEVVKILTNKYDVVIEQFRPGVMDRLGLGYEQLREVKPDLIYCSLTGYGQTGPYRNRAGHDLNYLAMSGAASYTGRRAADHPAEMPVPLGLQVADLAGGSHHAVIGVLAAQIHRQNTGEGQHIDISMTDAAFALNGLSGASALASGEDPEPGDGWLNSGSFYDYYETSDGRYMSVAGLEPKFVDELAETLGDPEFLLLKDLHDSALQERLKERLRERLLQHDFEHWRALFRDKDCCVEPVLTINEAAQHPQFDARQAVLNYASSIGSEHIRQAACPIRMSGYDQSKPYPAPTTGNDSVDVLTELGLSESKISELVNEKVVAMN